MEKNEVKKDSTMQILNAFKSGAIIMLVQAPFVNAFNQWSIVACRYNLSSLAAMKYILYGYGKLKQPSILNFRAGMSGHLGKEFPRLFFKSTGLYIFRPWLSMQSLSPTAVDIVFAGTLSVAEMVINPMDTWRVNVQAGKPLETSLRSLYTGSLGNGIRQFSTWWGFGYSNRKLDELLQNYTHLDPHSLAGIGTKAVPQSLFFTSLNYGIERVKNEMQYNNTKKGLEKPSRSQYIKAASNILNTQGTMGFFRGFSPKVGGNAILAVGANVLVEEGKKHFKSELIQNN